VDQAKVAAALASAFQEDPVMRFITHDWQVARRPKCWSMLRPAI